MTGSYARAILLFAFTAVLAACREPTEPSHTRAQGAALTEAAIEGDGNVLTIDHQVPHVSTVPANAGELVHLFLRERVRHGPNSGTPREAVLMIHGRSVPVLAVMALSYRDYDWATWLARSGGFDVFMLDFQGSGRSRHRMMDDPCNVPAAQQQRLIPNPLSTACPPSYPFTLNTAGSDLDELDTVIEYIRTLRGVDKVHLIGLSAGSFRIGAYGAAHPEKVASLLFYAPIFNAGVFPPPPPIPPTNPPSPLPRPGTPMTVETRADAFAGWDFEVGLTLGSGRCDDPLEPGIKDVVWAAIMENDELGRTWGPPPAGAPAGSPPEGLMRVRQLVQWGWNPEVASRLTLPTAIVWGEFDRGQGGRQDVAELYRLINNENKLRFTVQCGGHFLLWEKPRWILHQISKEWIKHGRVGGFEQGEFLVDTQGSLTPL
jgi:pimeloyl-ACP methyl ester carboxylesterase